MTNFQGDTMCKVFYKICDVNILVESEKELWESDEAAAFRVEPCDYDFKVLVTAVDAIPEVSMITENGELLVNSEVSKLLDPSERIGFAYIDTTSDFTVYTNNHMVVRRARDLFRPLPHALSIYPMENLKEVKTFVYEDYYKWATSSKYLWTSISINHLMLQFNTLFFHASYIRYNGDGILFTAASGMGKSTQAALWEAYKGAEIINGDKAAVRLEDSAKVYSTMFSGTSGICKNISSPLKAVIVLEKGLDNSVRRLSPIEILKYLLPNIFVDNVVDREKLKAIDLVIKLAAMVPVYFYSCTKDEGAVDVLYKILYGDDQEILF